MMGRGHALTGMVGAVVFGTVVGTLSPATLVLGASILPGAALLPDIDHANATVSKTFGPFTKVFSLVLGHRRETHSFPGIAVLAIGVQFSINAGAWYWRIPATLVLILCYSAFIRIFRIPGKWDDFAGIPIAAGVVYGLPLITPVDLRVVPIMIAMGMIVHVAGDVITLQGCPVWWPFSDSRVKLSWFRAGGAWEVWAVCPALAAVGAWLAFRSWITPDRSAWMTWFGWVVWTMILVYLGHPFRRRAKGKGNRATPIRTRAGMRPRAEGADLPPSRARGRA